MSERVEPCPACRGTSFAGLVDFGTVPRSGTFLSKPGEDFASIHLSFDYCEQCALIRQKSRDENPVHDYTQIPRATARQLPTYAEHIAKSLSSHGLGLQDLIVEVGANDGAFLNLLAGEGFTNLLGVEPSQSCAQLCREKGHKVEESYLDRSLVGSILERHGPVGAVICRHTLEHVPDPVGFVAAMRSLLREGGLLFIEVPNSHTIIHDLFGHELWDEHLHIFSPNNLATFVASAGFAIRRQAVWPQRGTSNILLWATHASASKQRVDAPADYVSDVHACSEFQVRWGAMSERVSDRLHHLNAPVVAIGASHPQSNYLLFTKLGEKVSALVDDDPAKQGLFVPIPQPVSIISTAQFSQYPPPGVVMQTAFGYDQWMDRLIAPLVARNVAIVRPYETRFLLAS